jgi:hypothetical protein
MGTRAAGWMSIALLAAACGDDGGDAYDGEIEIAVNIVQIDTAQVWNEETFVETINIIDPITVVVIYSPDTAETSTGVAAMFYPADDDAIMEVWAQIGVDQDGFTAVRGEDFFNFGVPNYVDAFIGCETDDISAVVGQLPVHPVNADGFGVTLYLRNADDPTRTNSMPGPIDVNVDTTAVYDIGGATFTQPDTRLNSAFNACTAALVTAPRELQLGARVTF